MMMQLKEQKECIKIKNMITKEEVDLLFQDICGRLKYEVKAKVYGWDEDEGEVELHLKIYSIDTDGYVRFEANDYGVNYLAVDDCLLYLRPMSSMTKEEKLELCKRAYVPDEMKTLEEKIKVIEINAKNASDFYNEHYFDYRGLIEKGLALEAPEGMYNFN